MIADSFSRMKFTLRCSDKLALGKEGSIDTVLNRLMPLSHYRTDNLVTPLTLQYLDLTVNYGHKPEVVLSGMEDHYRNNIPKVGDNYGL